MIRQPIRPPTPASLFTAFLKVGVLGFGGVAALARHELVIERGWLDERGFAEAFGIATTLPGANTVNMATMLGHRWCGLKGMAAALLGLLGAPLALLVVIAGLYSRFSYLADARAALAGAAAAAAGLVVGTAVQLLKGLDADIVAVAVAGCVCLAAACQVPVAVVLCVAVPCSLVASVGRTRWR